jgi:menaquinone-specific isochorismate synthase
VPGIGFLGGTPELLLSRNGKNIYSEAVAGTRRAGGEERAGGREVDAPNWSAKDRREIDIVRSAITDGLSAFCTRVECPTEPEIHRAGKIEHLRFPISGSLKADSSIADLVVALSPTPAVCGMPSEIAMSLIRELERFDRGWYAGPVGWISKDSAEFAVAIRSALVSQKTVHLYSGAGIVQGSEARSEWDELDAKIATLRSALGA